MFTKTRFQSGSQELLLKIPVTLLSKSFFYESLFRLDIYV